MFVVHEQHMILLQVDSIATAERISQLTVNGLLALAVVMLGVTCTYLYKQLRDMQKDEVSRAEERTEKMIAISTETKNAFQNLTVTATEIVEIVRELKYKP
jgi:sensor histidine kinase regulating citrate/malate metabolism